MNNGLQKHSYQYIFEEYSKILQVVLIRSIMDTLHSLPPMDLYTGPYPISS